MGHSGPWKAFIWSCGCGVAQLDSIGGGRPASAVSVTRVISHPPSVGYSSGQSPGQAVSEKKSSTTSSGFLFLGQRLKIFLRHGGKSFSSEIIIKEVAGFLSSSQKIDSFEYCLPQRRKTWNRGSAVLYIDSYTTLLHPRAIVWRWKHFRKAS